MVRPIATLLFAIPFLANAQELPQPSPHGEVEQIIGLTEVEVEYSRPSVKGRKIFGDLVPMNEIWRTGANRNTMISFDGPVKVQGEDVPQGTYSLFTIPGPESWIVILNRDTALWGADDYTDSLDVLRVKVKPEACEHTETMTFVFEDVVNDQARLDLRWESTRVSVVIAADAKDKAMVNIKEALAKPDASFRAYNSSARFCVDRNIMLKDALGWAKKSVEMDKKFWNTHTLALAYAANGDYKNAITSAEESLKLAQEADYKAYINMNKEKIDEWMTKVKAK